MQLQYDIFLNNQPKEKVLEIISFAISPLYLPINESKNILIKSVILKVMYLKTIDLLSSVKVKGYTKCPKDLEHAIAVTNTKNAMFFI